MEGESHQGEPVQNYPSERKSDVSRPTSRQQKGTILVFRVSFY